MRDKLLEFLEWFPNNIDDIFELLENPEEVVDKFLQDED